MPRLRATNLDARSLPETGRDVDRAVEVRCAPARRLSWPGSALLAPGDLGLFGLIWALILILVSTAGNLPAREVSSLSPPGGRRLTAMPALVLSRPLACPPRTESGPIVRSGEHSRFSESAHLEDLDGDDDDPIEVPASPLAHLTVSHLSHLIVVRAVLAPGWREPQFASSPLFPPLRC